MTKARDLADLLADGVVGSGEVADGSITEAKLASNAVTNAKIASGAVDAGKLASGAAVPSQSGQSGKYLTTDGSTTSWDTIDLTAFDEPVQLKNYTTTQRNALTGLVSGDTIYNSTTGSIEFYDGANWIATNLIPTVNSVTGTIYAGAASTLTLSITNATETISVRFSEGGSTVADVEDVTVTSGSASVTVPAAVYGQTAGDTIVVSILNQDGTPSSNAISKTVSGIPTGGTITTSGAYRIHTFTSSGTFTVPSSVSVTADILVVAGGGSGPNITNNAGGGGGAGGMLTFSSQALNSGSYTCTVGGGSAVATDAYGSTGGNSKFGSLTTALGGGCGGYQDISGQAGGSGGGAGGGGNGGSGGAGTSGQGYRGGNSGGSPYDGAGGGGAGGVGYDGGSAADARGGPGSQWNGVYYAGGGAGGLREGDPDSSVSGGIGGGGGYSKSTGGANGQANTGGGGGGSQGYSANGNGGTGGSGIVIVRYQL